MNLKACRNLKRFGCIVAIAACLFSTAQANDSSAVLEAGGIVLTRSKDVSMESEELWISRQLVRVSYVFKNTGPQDVRSRVAFPVPPIPVCDEDHVDHCESEGNLGIGDLSNPLSFKLTVDGKATPFQTERKTEMKEGVGTTSITHHWDQVFPKGRTVKISHEYIPAAGQFFTDTEGVSDGKFERDMVEIYCVEPKLLAGLKHKDQQFVSTVHYILKTGANWKGPIKRFKLTIAKDSPLDKVSVCLPDIRRTSATTFEVKRKNFVPQDDLKILFIPDLR